MNFYPWLGPGAEVIKAELLDPHLGAVGIKDNKADKSDVRDRGYILDLLYGIVIRRKDNDELCSALVGWEMQSKDFEDLMKRWVLYGGRLYSGQSSKGQPIGREKPFYIMVFLENEIAFLRSLVILKSMGSAVYYVLPMCTIHALYFLISLGYLLRWESLI